MNSRRIFATAAVVLAVGGAVVAWRALHATRAADTAVEAMSHERERTELAAHALEAKIASAAKRRAELTAEREKLPAAPSAKPSAPPSRPPSRMNSPEEQAKMTRVFRAKLRFEQLPFYRAAGLSDSQVARLEDIFTEHDARGRDIQVTAREQRLPANDPAIATLRKEEAERYATELRTLLGDDGRRQFEEFQTGASNRRGVAELAGNLALTPTPLTPEQGQRLNALFREVRFQQRQTDPKMWDDLFQRTQGLLAAPQLAELRAMHAGKSEIAFQELQRLAEKAKK